MITAKDMELVTEEDLPGCYSSLFTTSKGQEHTGHKSAQTLQAANDSCSVKTVEDSGSIAVSWPVSETGSHETLQGIKREGTKAEESRSLASLAFLTNSSSSVLKQDKARSSEEKPRPLSGEHSVKFDVKEMIPMLPEHNPFPNTDLRQQMPSSIYYSYAYY